MQRLSARHQLQFWVSRTWSNETNTNSSATKHGTSSRWAHSSTGLNLNSRICPVLSGTGTRSAEASSITKNLILIPRWLKKSHRLRLGGICCCSTWICMQSSRTTRKIKPLRWSKLGRRGELSPKWGSKSTRHLSNSICPTRRTLIISRRSQSSRTFKRLRWRCASMFTLKLRRIRLGSGSLISLQFRKVRPSDD